MNTSETFEDLIKKRQGCTICHESNKLYHFENVIKDSPILLGLWDPLESNSNDAEILIVGQDFSDRSYLEKAKNIKGIKDLEANNPTNGKLKRYLETAGLYNQKIYFTNSILCIKNGETKTTKKGTSMSTPIKRKWCINCSDKFLKPLIVDHLPNVKIIITLGANALLSINNISDAEKNTELNNTNAKKAPFTDYLAIEKNIVVSGITYKLIPMAHPSFEHLTLSKHAKNANQLWEGVKKLLDS